MFGQVIDVVRLFANALEDEFSSVGGVTEEVVHETKPLDNTLNPSNGINFNIWDGDVTDLEHHFNKHGQDFGISSPEDYLNLADQFFKKGYDEKLPMLEYPNGGEIGIYDAQTNSYGIYTSEGKIISFYKPTSSNYFQRQVENAVNRGGKIINPLK